MLQIKCYTKESVQIMTKEKELHTGCAFMKMLGRGFSIILFKTLHADCI